MNVNLYCMHTLFGLCVVPFSASLESDLEKGKVNVDL